MSITPTSGISKKSNMKITFVRRYDFMLLLTNGRVHKVVLGVGWVIFLYYHLEIHLLNSQRGKLSQRVKDS